MNIISKIDQNIGKIEKSEYDAIADELLIFFDQKIKSLANYAYGSVIHYDDGPSISVKAFKEYAKTSLVNGLETFITLHKNSGRSIGPYLTTILNRKAEYIRSDLLCAKKMTAPICPACKLYGNKEFLTIENKNLHCNECKQEITRLENQISLSNSFKDKLQDKLRLRKIFVSHSRKGYRCPECERFIPDSYISQYGVSCVYNDCGYFGTLNELESARHPTGLKYESFVWLDSTNNEGASKADYYTMHLQPENAEAFSNIDIKEQCENEYNILIDTIKAQEDKIKRTEKPNKSRLKLLMYQSFKNMIDSDTEDMVSYLARGKHFSEHPLQSRIFQEFIRLVENNLPFTVTKGGTDYEVYTLRDPIINLFLGVSEFDSIIKNGIIPNMTIETYLGGRQMKDFGRCFIGKLLDITDVKTGRSLINNVLGYTFVDIRMDASVFEGTEVKVSHLRIPSHYEMLGMVPLQRIRRKLVDSVYLKLYGKKRIVKGSDNAEN